MARFTLPRDLYFGENALETLKTIKGNKAVLCLGGGSMKRFGFVDKVVEYLKEAGIETKLIEGIEPERKKSNPCSRRRFHETSGIS